MSAAPVWRLNGAALCLVGAFLAAEHRDGGPEMTRAFMPGAMGREEGEAAASVAASPAGFTTRAMYRVADDGGAWATANGLTKSFAFSHNLSAIFPPALHAERPEFFPLVAGKRIRPDPGAYSWNPDLGREDVAVHAAEAARRHFAEHPDAESFAVGVNDGLMFGESAETLAAIGPVRWFRERPDFSNLVFGFTNRVADELARTHPDKYVGALAYYWAENVPEFRIHPQVVPFLTADRAQGYDRAFREEERALQAKWARAADVTRGVRADAGNPGTPPRRLGLYDYLYGYGFLVPRIHTRLLAENLRQAHRAGFTDYYAEVIPNWGLDGPMPWLAAQLLLDPEQSPEILLEEYYTRYFRRAAGPMRRFFETCERQWMTQAGPAYWLKHYRNESQAALFPPRVRRALRELLDEAQRGSARDATARRRVEFVGRAFGVTERFAAMNEAREGLTRATLEAASNWRTMTEGLSRLLAARKDFRDYTEQVLAEARPPLQAFLWEDYLRHDPASHALIAIHRAATAAGELADAEVALRATLPDELLRVWRAVSDSGEGASRQVLRDGALRGAPKPAKRIARLDYGVPMPEPWLSRAEPVQHQRSAWLAAEPRVLELTGHKETMIYQWNPVVGEKAHFAEVQVRGRAGASTVVQLTVGWLDAQARWVGLQVLRLPEGDWPDWVTLRVAALPPPKAQWVGVGLRVQNQQRADWVQLRDFSLVTPTGEAR